MIKVLFVIYFVPSAFSAPNNDPPCDGLSVENVNLDNQSASLKLKCSWHEPDNVNLSWSVLVDDIPADAGATLTIACNAKKPGTDEIYRKCRSFFHCSWKEYCKWINLMNLQNVT